MEIQEIKSRLPITSVLKHYHLTFDRNNMLKCPFHEDKEASLKIYPRTNTFNCFGCDANGDVIEFIQLKEGCGKHEAIVKAGELDGPGSQVKIQTVKPPATKSKEEATDPDREGRIELLTKLFGYFRGAINNSDLRGSISPRSGGWSCFWRSGITRVSSTMAKEWTNATS